MNKNNCGEDEKKYFVRMIKKSVLHLLSKKVVIIDKMSKKIDFWLQQMGEAKKPLSAKVEERLFEKRKVEVLPMSESNNQEFLMEHVFRGSNPVLPGEDLPTFVCKGVFQGAEREFSSEDFYGQNLLILFYPKNFTEVTADVFDSLHKISSKYIDLKIVTVSTDSLDAHHKWSESLGESAPPFIMLSDDCGELSKTVGVFDQKKHVSYSSIFLVNKHGIVQYSQVCGGSLNLFENIEQNIEDLYFTKIEID